MPVGTACPLVWFWFAHSGGAFRRGEQKYLEVLTEKSQETQADLFGTTFVEQVRLLAAIRGDFQNEKVFQEQRR